MKFLLTTMIWITAISFAVKGQTIVSGGIYSNTTWTLVNSPYIVTDNVVVFPGVTLTIEPGVTVRFDSTKNLEVRNANLIASGTTVDSITFTSNSINPIAGIWGGIYLNVVLPSTSFNFCHFQYATSGIYFGPSTAVGVKNSIFINNISGIHNIVRSPIDSCTFRFNTYGLKHVIRCSFNFCNISRNNYGIDVLSESSLINCVIDSNQSGLGGDEGADGIINNCMFRNNGIAVISDGSFAERIKVENCIFKYNGTIGLKLSGYEADTVVNCEFTYNGIGLVAEACGFNGDKGIVTNNIIENNNIGIQVGGCIDIYCNKFCNNTSFDLENLESSPRNVANNYWCSKDSLTIETHINDGYDNTNLGLITFMPIDTFQCYLINGISIHETQPLSFNIYPNPAPDYLTIELPENIFNTDIKIFNITDELIYSSITLKQKTTIDISILNAGVFILQISNRERISRQKFIKQ